MGLRSFLRAVREWLGRPWTLGGAAGLAVVLTSLAGTWEVAELKLLDAQLRFRGPLPQRGEVVLVGIAEDTFEALGRAWPLPRATIAQAIERIQVAKPKAVGVDLLFTEPSVFGPEDDAALAATLRRYDDVVLGALYEIERGEPVALPSGAVGRRVYQVLRLPVEPLPHSTFGFVNVLHDEDGFVRRVPLYREFRTVGRVESLAARVAAVGGREGGGARRPAGREILINFRGGPRAFETVPFHQVLRGEVEPRQLAGRIVLIGATAPALHDVFSTPFAPRDPMPGVEIQANVVDNLLRGDPLRPAGKTLPLVLAVLAAALGASVGSRVPPPKSFWPVALVGLGYAVAAHAALRWFQVWLEQVPVHLALFGGYFAVLVSGAPYRLFSPPPPALQGKLGP